MNYIEIEFSDGTKARWTIEDDKIADSVAAYAQLTIGPPDTVLT